MRLHKFNICIHLEWILLKRLNRIASEGVLVSCTIHTQQKTTWMLAKIHYDNKPAIPKMGHTTSEIR